MADFCADCTVTVMQHDQPADNDLAGWLGGQLGYGWALCEGCGLHLFNDRGRRRCRDRRGPAVGACSACTELDRAGGVYVVEPLRSTRCCNCNAKLGFALVSDAVEVGATPAPAVDLGDGSRVCLMCFYPF